MFLSPSVTRTAVRVTNVVTNTDSHSLPTLVLTLVGRKSKSYRGKDCYHQRYKTILSLVATLSLLDFNPLENLEILL